jgi:hypothetical protein
MGGSLAGSKGVAAGVESFRSSLQAELASMGGMADASARNLEGTDLAGAAGAANGGSGGGLDGRGVAVPMSGEGRQVAGAAGSETAGNGTAGRSALLGGAGKSLTIGARIGLQAEDENAAVAGRSMSEQKVGSELRGSGSKSEAEKNALRPGTPKADAATGAGSALGAIAANPVAGAVNMVPVQVNAQADVHAEPAAMILAGRLNAADAAVPSATAFGSGSGMGAGSSASARGLGPARSLGGVDNHPGTPARAPSVPQLPGSGTGGFHPSPESSATSAGSSAISESGAGGGEAGRRAEALPVPGSLSGSGLQALGSRGLGTHAAGSHGSDKGTAMPANLNGGLSAGGSGSGADGTPSAAAIAAADGAKGLAETAAAGSVAGPEAGHALAERQQAAAAARSAGEGQAAEAPAVGEGANLARASIAAAGQGPDAQANALMQPAAAGGSGSGAAASAGKRPAVAGVGGVSAGRASVALPASGAAGDGAGWIGGPAEFQRSQTSSNGSNMGTAEPALREPFAALDDAAPGAPMVTHASSRQIEAGFQDQELGWVGVRADLSGGGVHAVLVPGSAEAAQTLGTHLEGLHTYLAAEHPAVSSLGIDAPSERNAEAGTQQGMGQGASQQDSQSSREPAFASPPRIAGTDSSAADGPRLAAAEPETYARAGASGGSRISVMA